MGARLYTAVMWNNGQRIDYIPILSIDGALSTNDIGFCSIITPRTKPLSYYVIDNDVLIHRYPEDAHLGGIAIFSGKILDRDEWEDENGEYTEIGIYGLNELLSRRYVNYQATVEGTTGYTIMTDYADDMLKEIVTDNMGADAVAARQFPSGFTIETQRGAAPSITMEFPHQNVLAVLQDIAERSAQAGTDLFFDVVWKNHNAFEFRTYINQLGVDTTQGMEGTRFADFKGNISNAKLSEKFSGEYNYVGAYGAGSPGNQAYEYAEDTDRQRSPYGLREYLIQESLSGDALESAAYVELQYGRPITTFSCELLEGIGRSIYGVHWKFGDKVKVGYNGKTYTGIVRSVSFSWSPGSDESLTGDFNYQGVI